MKISTLLALPLAVLTALVVSSCEFEKDYRINGQLNIPSEIPYGDTVIQVPSPEGEWVYMVEGGEPIDSCQIIDGKYSFTGKVKPSDAYFAQLVSMFFGAVVAVEPGEIEVNTNDLDNTTVSGTPSNDGIKGMMDALVQLETVMQDKISELEQDLEENSAEAQYELFNEIQNEYATRQAAILDSVYEANKDNLASIYAVVMRHADNNSSAEMEEAIGKYPDRVKNHPFVREILNAIRQQEAMYRNYSDESEETE